MLSLAWYEWKYQELVYVEVLQLILKHQLENIVTMRLHVVKFEPEYIQQMGLRLAIQNRIIL